MPDDELRRRLLALARADDELRSELVRDGALFDGYNTRMAELQARNAQELGAIVATVGWPGRSLVADDGAEAAWCVLQHAIGSPALQRDCLPLVREAAAAGDVPAAYAALLEDRIAYSEGRPQRYGTQFDWDCDGQMSPWLIEDADGVEVRRASVGLPPLAQQQERLRAVVAREGERPPENYEERQRQIRAWAERLGWLGTSDDESDDP
jgi:hypothetical protein